MCHIAPRNLYYGYMLSQTVCLRSVILVAAAAIGGCITTPTRATMDQLHRRAQVDFRCAPQYMRAYQLDQRTQLVQGCYQERVYVEHCDKLLSTCSWVDNSTPKRATTVPTHDQRATCRGTIAVKSKHTTIANKQARVRVASKGGFCQVAVNGIAYGPTPIARISVPPGKVEITCHDRLGNVSKKRLKAKSGQVLSVMFPVERAAQESTSGRAGGGHML